MNDRDQSKKRIAIIGGTGNEGPGLAMRWANAGYRITIGSREESRAVETANRVNTELGIDSISGMQNNDAVRNSDICVLTVVYTAHRSAVESLKADLNGKILIDATARIDFRNPKPPEPPSAGRIAQKVLGQDVKVVAAFQNVPAHVLKKDLDKPIDTDVLVFSDDREAANVAIELAQAGGMKAYFAGDLDNAIVAEGITALLIDINKNYGVKNASIGITGLMN
jgi:NADPH-dependent F420 reductase